ncbi:hypothetical protein [Chryseobacterium sp. FH1]|uniref:hypothetical protein n=1 Tax=Chryseobacterium sp. FH1 TaxID=1233951 RepID=UPI00103DA185|nr:hypothetical protein [Chryseobacterium sp. FH1]
MRINLKLHTLNLVIFLLLLISCNKKSENLNHQNQSKIENEVSEKIVYDFVNEILSQNETSEFCKNVIDRKTFIAINGDSIFIEKFKNEFNENDLEFMRNQYLSANKFIWKNELKNRQILKLDTTINNDISREQFWSKTLEKYGCICYVNMPIFNKEKNIAIIEIGYNCGFLCGAGATYIYKLNENEKWILFKTIDNFVSYKHSR